MKKIFGKYFKDFLKQTFMKSLFSFGLEIKSNVQLPC